MRIELFEGLTTGFTVSRHNESFLFHLACNNAVTKGNGLLWHERINGSGVLNICLRIHYYKMTTRMHRVPMNKSPCASKFRKFFNAFFLEKGFEKSRIKIRKIFQLVERTVSYFRWHSMIYICCMHWIVFLLWSILIIEETFVEIKLVIHNLLLMRWISYL